MLNKLIILIRKYWDNENGKRNDEINHSIEVWRIEENGKLRWENSKQRLIYVLRNVIPSDA